MLEPLSREVKNIILNKFKVDQFDTGITNGEEMYLTLALKKERILYEEFSSELNLNNIKKTIIKVDGITLFIIPFNDDPEKFLVLKFSKYWPQHPFYLNYNNKAGRLCALKTGSFQKNFD